MFEIKSGSRMVDKADIGTWTGEFLHACILETEVGTTGYCGGDSGHGGRTYFRLKTDGGADMRVNGEETDEVEIVFGGDAELSNFIQGLEFVLQVLKENTEQK